MAHKTWQQKLTSGKPPHVEVLEKAFGGAQPGARMLVSSPRAVDDYIRSLAPGTTQGVAELRAGLAQAAEADLACPLSTSIFVRIAAEAALEELEMGRTTREVTPFWRVIEPTSPLAKKLSCGPDFVSAQRAAEA